ncbi:MAG TPA: peptide chain release factor N(5)-glutamine methyltransferase [Casimicrobiaceae bacterium]|nr:peptide chain release factor N(5)-glutamine methyltransferase [Casimicrobiaceae bacterium]
MNDVFSVRRALETSGLVPSDARALLAHVLACDRAWLIAHANDAIERVAADRFFALANRRRDGEPVAYLTGFREFYGLDLRVSPAVLIPRPETETLVEAALERLPSDVPLRVLDIGTGSGAIALAIAHERPNAIVTATDVSSAALDLAQENAQRLGLGNVEFIASDVYRDTPDVRFDAIVSNPPYIAAGDPHLASGDVRFEPRAALTPATDGLTLLRAIIAGARRRLDRGGSLVVEHGHDQAEAVAALFVEAGFESLVSLRDLAGIPRVAAGRSP